MEKGEQRREVVANRSRGRYLDEDGPSIQKNGNKYAR